MISQGVAQQDPAGLGLAGLGMARQYVPQYGNWDNFSGPGKARYGQARFGRVRRGLAGLGMARLNAFRWAVSPDTFRSNN